MTGKRPKYVSLEPAAFLSDYDFQMMNAEERGVYTSIIFYLYCNDGKMKNSDPLLRKVCNCNCEFDFQSVLRKFKIRRGYIRHKRVTEELRKAQVLVNRGVKAAKTRWLKQCSSNAQASHKHMPSEAKRSNDKLSKVNENEASASARFLRPSLRLADKLAKCFPCESDKVALGNLVTWLISRIVSGELSETVFDRVVEIAEECKSGRKPIAVFFGDKGKLRQEIGYNAKAEKEKLNVR